MNLFRGILFGMTIALLILIARTKSAVKKGLFCNYSHLQHDPELLEILKRELVKYKISARAVKPEFRELVMTYDAIVMCYRDGSSCRDFVNHIQDMPIELPKSLYAINQWYLSETSNDEY